MDRIQHDSALPLHQQLGELIREQIEKGIYQVGDQIPSESKLCEQYGLSRVTVRSALDNLVEDNILVRIQGKGTFVSVPAQTDRRSAGGSFTRSCICMGIVPSTRLMEKKWIPAEPGLANWLSIPEGSRVLCIRRVRMMDGAPAVYEVDYLPEALGLVLEKEDVEHNSLLWLIQERTGHKVDSFESTPGVRYLDRECANALGCKTGIPILWVGQVAYSEEKIIYYNEQFIRSDRYSYSIKSIVT
ncbi:MAG: GntR family transcriptional regulator [Faecousia sp.]